MYLVRIEHAGYDQEPLKAAWYLELGELITSLMTTFNNKVTITVTKVDDEDKDGLVAK